MRIGGFNKSSLTDYPGQTAAVIFTQGCNWRCPFCHNPSLVIPAQYSDEIPEERIMANLTRRKGRLAAVVVTGGEPTLQGDLLPFLEKLKKLDLLIKLDTNGSRPEILREVVRRHLVDYLAMDIKAPLANYAEACGVRLDVECVRTSLWIVKNSGLPHELRTTVIPGLHTVQEIRELGQLVQGAQRFVVQEFLSDSTLRPEYKGRVAFTRKTLADMEKYFRNKVSEYVVRTTEEGLAQPEPVEQEAEALV
ncbi:MAG: anaerobic ribonucleoside-triphosphate reductase activating protein [Verrucomicrobiota bacterium]|nr:anaerobic ribonucleoside-triphosphate reductase activating protein [Verrucomicrobiota bacterium]